MDNDKWHLITWEGHGAPYSVFRTAQLTLCVFATYVCKLLLDSHLVTIRSIISQSAIHQIAVKAKKGLP